MSHHRRPSSATSHSSRLSSNQQSDSELKLECRAVFLGHYSDIKDEIESKDDLIKLVQQTGRNASSKIISKYWTSTTDSITFDDFVDICRREPVTTEDDLMKAFRKIDLNGDGYISLEELSRVLTTKGEKMSKNEVREMIEEVDENNDGKLDYIEFSKMVISSTEDFKKMSIKVMEKKEKRKLRQQDEALSPRKGTNSDRRGSRRLSNLSSTVHDDIGKPSPRPRRESRPKSASRGLLAPSNLREWNSVQSKGVFFLEENGDIISHLYSLILPQDSDIWITMQHLNIGESGESLDGTITDTSLFILRKDNNSLVAFTDNKDNRGKYSLRCTLPAGTYFLIPYSTGCRLKPRNDVPTKEAKLISKEKDGKVTLTRAFRKGLEEIFNMTDLDGNGLLSRSEFNWYNLRTSGEEVGDDEWQVVEDNIELENGEITFNGFIRLNEMEAEDNEGDTDDAWVTMTSMGFSKSLILDEACPFLLKVYSEDCANLKLKVIGLQSNKDRTDSAACEFAIAKGEPIKLRGTKDVILYQYVNDHMALIVVNNKSKTRVKVQLDCQRSKNLTSHTRSLLTTLVVQPQSSSVGHFLLPLDDSKEFKLECEESILAS